MTARIPDHNGWYEIANNPLSKVGVFAYLGRSIGDPKLDPNAIYYVYRPAEELSDPNTLSSFRLVPWIENHVMLGDESQPGYVPAEKKGVHGVTGENIWFDNVSGVMYGNIKVFSSSLQQTIDGGKVDLSLGYRCKYDPTPGVFDGKVYQYVQRHIRGNHMASVDDGRMGDDVSVMDSLIATFDAKDMIPMPASKWLTAKKKRLTTMREALKSKTSLSPATVAAMDAEEAASGEPTLGDIADLMTDVLPQIADINEAIASAGAAGGGTADPTDINDDDDMEPEMDAAGKPVMDAAGKPVMKKKVKTGVPAPLPAGDKKVTMDKAAMDAAISTAVTAALAPLTTKIAKLESGGVKAMLGEVAKRDALAKQLSHFVGTFDHSEMTLSEVATYGVKKLEIPTTDGHEVSALTAYLHGRVAPTPQTGMDAAPKAGGKLAAYLAG